MISIFNGKKRSLGRGGVPKVFVQVDVDLRNHLHLFKGARLAVLLAIALHADEDGWAWPSYETLKRETGYGEGTIKKALADLCALEIDGQRVLLRYQPTGEGGKFGSNRYLIFPSAEEVQRYEGAGVTHLGAEAAKGDRGTKSVPRSTVVQKTVVRKPYDEQEPHRTITNTQEEERESETRENDTDAARIAARLCGLGIFPNPAEDIAREMAKAGLTPDEAEEIALKTLRATDGNVGQAVYRLQQRVWDAGEAAARAVAKARYAEEPEPELPLAPVGKNDRRPEETLWQAALAQLELEMTKATFNTHLRRSRLVAYDDGVFTVAVLNEYSRGWLEHRLVPTILRVLRHLAGREDVSIRFVTEAEWAEESVAEVRA